MKQLIILNLVLLPFGAFSQGGPLAKKLVSLFLKAEAPAARMSVRALKKEYGVIAGRYKTLTAAERKAFSSGVDVKYSAQFKKFVDDHLQGADLNVFPFAALPVKPSGFPVMENSAKKDIMELQKTLNSLGYNKVEVDGVMGKNTKDALCNFLGKDFPENGKHLRPFILKSRVNKKVIDLANETRKHLEFKKVDVEIRNDKGEIVEKKVLGTKPEFEDFVSKYPCGIDEGCISISDPALSGTFFCEMGGNKVSINLSSEGSFDVKLKSKTGESITVGYGDGSVKITAANKHASRTVDLPD